MSGNISILMDPRWSKFVQEWSPEYYEPLVAERNVCSEARVWEIDVILRAEFDEWLTHRARIVELRAAGATLCDCGKYCNGTHLVMGEKHYHFCKISICDNCSATRGCAE